MRLRAPHTSAGSKQVLGPALGPSNHQADSRLRSGQIDARHRSRNAAGHGARPVHDGDRELCDPPRTGRYGGRVPTRNRTRTTCGPAQSLGLVSLRRRLSLDGVGDGRAAGATREVSALARTSRRSRAVHPVSEGARIVTNESKRFLSWLGDAGGLMSRPVPPKKLSAARLLRFASDGRRLFGRAEHPPLHDLRHPRVGENASSAGH